MSSGSPSIRVRRDGPAVILALPSQLVEDLGAEIAAVLDEALQEPAEMVVADLSDVTLANTAGLGNLVGLVRLTLDAGVRVAFAGARGRTAVLMERLHMERYARVFESVNQAVGDSGRP